MASFHFAVRQAKKARVLQQQQQYSRLRWAVVAVLLAVAVIGFCYYYWYYQTTDLPGKRTRQGVPKPRGEKPKGDGKHKPGTAQKANKAQKEEKAKKGKKTDKKGNAGQKGLKEGDAKSKKGKGRTAKEQAEINRLENMKKRVLRQPMAASDPDKPHVLEIITADNLLLEGNFKDALDRFNAILSLFPQSPRALLGKGLTLVRMAKQKKSNKLMDTAINFLRQVGIESFLATDAVKLSALLAMVDHARDRGNLQLAIKGTEKLVELYEDNVVYANQLGVLHLSRGDKKKARAQFKKNVKRFDDNAYSKAQLGYILYSEKQYEQALPLLLEGIRQDEEIRKNGNFYNYAGDALVRLNRSEEVGYLHLSWGGGGGEVGSAHGSSFPFLFLLPHSTPPPPSPPTPPLLLPLHPLHPSSSLSTPSSSLSTPPPPSPPSSSLFTPSSSLSTPLPPSPPPPPPSPPLLPLLFLLHNPPSSSTPLVPSSSS